MVSLHLYLYLHTNYRFYIADTMQILRFIPLMKQIQLQQAITARFVFEAKTLTG